MPGGRARAAADTAAIVVTSGTEGTPKGVELTRAGMEVMGRGYSAGLDAGPGDRWLACLPLHHVASLGALARSYVTGVPCTVHDGFDLERVARSPRAEGTTIVSLVPTAMRRLLDAGAPLHEFRIVIVGGAPCPPALRARAEARRRRASSTRTASPRPGAASRSTACRSPAPRCGSAADARDPRAGRDGDARRTGSTRSVPAGAIDADGWFRTGDVGAVDADGRVHVVDRLKDLVITGGVNVSPTEVEACSRAIPTSHDVCVVGVPDDEWGELVVAFVVPAPVPARRRSKSCARSGESTLSGPKLPRAARVVDAIPRTASGKPLRRLLRDSTATEDVGGT